MKTEGQWNGLYWKIDEDGKLEISGTYAGTAEEGEIPNWLEYAGEIKTAVAAADNVKSMHKWFFECQNLESMDISRINTSQVMNMSSMFEGCNSLTSVDVSGFDTSQVTNMDGMFDGCTGLKSLDLSNFDMSKVTITCFGEPIFSDCGNLTQLEVPLRVQVDSELPSNGIWKDTEGNT